MKKVIASTMAALFVTVIGASAVGAASYDASEKPGIYKEYKQSDNQKQNPPKKAGPRESENN